LSLFFDVSFFVPDPSPAASSAAFSSGCIAERAVPTAAMPAATAASFATCFRVEVLGRIDFFAFVGRLAFVVLLLFDLAAARFRLVFDLTRRFDEAFDLARFFAFFMILPIRFGLWFRLGLALVQIGPQSVYWQAGRKLDFLPLIASRTNLSGGGARFHESTGASEAKSSSAIIGSEGKLRDRPLMRGKKRRPPIPSSSG
jgi:hypothetical protein